MDIFISYAREDRSTAELLARCLAGRGWSVWWDREIEAGDNFASVIEAELTHARTVIVLWSGHSLASSWVRNEAAEGEKRRALIPVLIENGIEQPLAFRHLQSVSLADWSGDTSNDAYRELVRALTTEIEGRPAATETEAQRSHWAVANSLEPSAYHARVSGSPTVQPRARVTVALLGGCLLLATIGAVVAIRIWGAPAPPSPALASTVSSGPSASTRDNEMPADKPVVQLWADGYDKSSERVNSQERHPASAAFDGNRQSAWNSLSSSEGKSEWIEAKFSEPVYVHHVTVYNGYQFLTTRGESLFFKNLRAKSLDVYADQETLPIAHAEFGRMDQTPVSIDVRHKARALRFSVTEAWPADNSAIGRHGDVCISEIEIFGYRGL